ncbi:alpha/beta hydrolase [Conexibacter sp. SYSU D00693]|uniref:alpha/beta hydrolase n=1 Tax=Conexibacter sp. SYSU D00693 TaxID=2812560 RepID=UPI00196A918A|nr:alpha/beta hydrolase [Conexibacter sp. SYSU D00693]
MLRRRLLPALAALLAAACAAPAAASAATVEVPVTFQVRNTNTSGVPCPADGRTYALRGHLVGPAERLTSPDPGAVALYAHGLAYGEFFWNFKAVPGYDYARQQADERGLVSVVVDRLGYGASGRPYGKSVCIGSEADYLHQVVQQLRRGSYTVGFGAPPSFSKVALVGHSLGGFMVEVAAATYRDVDALVVAGLSNLGSSLLTYATFTRNTLDCLLFPRPDGRAWFGATAADFRAGHLFDVDPAVADAVTARRAPDPCGDTSSAIPAIVLDVLRNGTIEVPVLLAHGANDALFPPPAGPLERALFLGSQDVTQVTLPRTGHAMTLGRTSPAFRATVGDWLVARGF